MLLNIVGSSNAKSKDVLWKFINRFHKDIKSKDYPILDSLTEYAINYFNEKVEPNKKFKTPEGGNVTALDDVSLEVNAKEFITLLGPSGCGKTTLLRSISGFEELDSGQIIIDSQEMRNVPPYKRPVNTVFQSYALFPHINVENNIGYG